MTALDQDADEIDDRVGAHDGLGDGRGVADVDPHGDDLPDIAHGLQEGRGHRVANRDAYDVAARGQTPHEMPTNEARAAENSHTARRRLHPTLHSDHIRRLQPRPPRGQGWRVRRKLRRGHDIAFDAQPPLGY